ncbi:MAG TPA: tRNA 4-thiouridine(8) synthase ThiI [Candidatus Saccharicenans sp.]|jgi:tRNA U34 2-thiouridine synthase MnmA/TrmU|nr:tRNA 4-thiouridine(8) synthase ThiI [Candidatus Saccharicenans sp.]HRD01554.1 tRNA 4-thiouridine(8) synthase ThiI [Candidatus Saccharicenans sp.]
MNVKEIRPPGEKKSRVRTLLLLSGGLDSLLAGKVLEEQGVEIVGLTFESVFFEAARAIAAAEMLNWYLILVDITGEQIEIIEHPGYGYGRHLNPCIDCHGQMVRLAAELLPRYQADFVSTGEVLGERPKSQNRQSLGLVEKLSGARGLLLRPLSARLLPPTSPEELGLVNRQKLLDLAGRSRQRQIELARHYGLTDYPTPAGGCLLTDSVFSQRLKQLRDWRGSWLREDIELIKHGRVFFDDDGLIIVGRHHEENEKIEKKALASDLLITLPDYKGPLTVIRFKDKNHPALRQLDIFDQPLAKKAALLTIRYSRSRSAEEASVLLLTPIRAQSRIFKREEWLPYL